MEKNVWRTQSLNVHVKVYISYESLNEFCLNFKKKKNLREVMFAVFQ